MSQNFGMHLTPLFSSLREEGTGQEVGKYDYFNKPFGLRHWMENGRGVEIDPLTNRMRAIAIVLAAEMVPWIQLEKQVNLTETELEGLVAES